MRRNARSVFAVAVTVLLLTAVSGVAFAEHHEKAAPKYTMIHYDDVGPADAPAYEENAKAWVAAFKEAEMGEDWSWYTYAGPNFAYAFLTDVPNYASLDKQDERFAAMAEKIGEDKIEALSANAGSNAHWHELTKDLTELDYTPEGGVGEVGFVHVGTHYVKPGMEDDFKGLVKKVNDARVKAGGELAVRYSEVQFGTGSFTAATLAKDRASYYSGESVGAILAEVYGPEEAQKIGAAWRDCITDYETSDWTFKPELSYMPGMYEDEEMMDDKEEMAEGE